MKGHPQGDTSTENHNILDIKFHLTVEGSLGILAYGDLGLLAWRKIKQGKRNPEKTNE